MERVETKKINFYISYIKGVALIFIILIHLIDWSSIPSFLGIILLKELLHVGILLFVLTAGAVISIAYKNKTFQQAAKRLFFRGAQLLFFYYLYSFLKLFIFDFSSEPFYEQFTSIGRLTFQNILMFQSFSVPLTILITYVFLLFISPFLLFINKRFRYAKFVVLALLFLLFIVNYGSYIPFLNNPIVNFLYANGYAIFPTALWLFPFLIGFFLSQIGFEKEKKKMLILSGLALVVYVVTFFYEGKSLFPSNYQFPLDFYFIVFCVFVMSLFFYLFEYVEKNKNLVTRRILSGIRLLGDNTLHLYIYHWIVIDCTIWLFAPYTWSIWISIPIFFVAYLFFRKEKLETYYLHQKNHIPETRTEIS